MALQTVGLKTRMWNNNIWSLVMLSTLPVTLFFMIWGIIYVYFDLENMGLFIDDFWSTLFMSENGQPLLEKLVHDDVGVQSLETAIAAMPFILVIVVVWYALAWRLNANIMRGLTGARSVTRNDQPRLYNLVETLAISRGLPTPKISIMHTPSLNAFASGVDRQSYMITVTSGLLDRLTDEELKAVLAHELTHIKNNDVRLMIVVSVFAGMVSILMTLAGHLMMPRLFSSDDIDGLPTPHVGYYLFMVMVWILANIALLVTMVSKFAISRRREFMADAGAVELTKKPGALISALKKLEGRSCTAGIPGDIAEMCIMPAALHDVFSTHPSIEARIEALAQYGGFDRKEIQRERAKRKKRGKVNRSAAGKIAGALSLQGFGKRQSTLRDQQS